jgi:two-component system sensor histidine kinase DesK
MVGMSGRDGWWRGKSTPAKIETYTRWSFHTFPFIEVATFALPAFGYVPAPANWILLLLVSAHAALGAVTASLTLDWTRGRRPRPVRLLWALGTATVVIAVVSLLVALHGPRGADNGAAAGTVFVGVLSFGIGTLALAVREARHMAYAVLGTALGACAVAVPAGVPAPSAVVAAGAVVLAAGFFTFTSAFSVWLLNAVYELDEARETRARLAVAEERLRFGRDLHDVMGRNLAVVALKSELAVQLARRGRPEAVEQMVEVQRIARETQREVREVVRGYREADLRTELAGAQGVLTAAGIDCEVSGPVPGLPTEIQSALGWVVREATTNVLRHGDAGRCAVSLRVAEGRVTLTVENDGAPGPDTGTGAGTRPGAAEPGRGSGLAGLRERLGEVDGVLRAGPAGGDLFRLTAEVPLPPDSIPEQAPAPEPGGSPRPVPHPVSEVTS